MGQYYYIVNLDKKEYLHPHRFGDGLKLLEMACSSSGVLAGLSILLADGNGRGGGDLCTNGAVKVKDDCWGVTFSSSRARKGERVEHKWTRDDVEYQTRVPDISGHWAGDRIVVAGDYADKGKFLTPEQEQEWKLSFPPSEWRELVERRGEEPKPNLQDYAERCMTDISETVILGMCSNKWVREDIIARLVDGFCSKDNAPLLQQIAKRYDCSEQITKVKEEVARKWAERRAAI